MGARLVIATTKKRIVWRVIRSEGKPVLWLVSNRIRY